MEKEIQHPINVSLETTPETTQQIIEALKDFIVDGVLQIDFLNGRMWLTSDLEGNIAFNFRQEDMQPSVLTKIKESFEI